MKKMNLPYKKNNSKLRVGKLEVSLSKEVKLTKKELKKNSYWKSKHLLKEDRIQSKEDR